jgi:hypothetical protein
VAKVKIKASKEAVEKAEDQGDFVLAPKGVYVADLVECAPGYAKGDDQKPDKTRPYLECVWKITGVGREDAKPPERYGNVWDYVSFSEESEWKRAQFGTAVGLPLKNGEIDGEIEIEEGKPGSVIGVRALLRLKHEKDRENEPKAKIGWMGPLTGPALSDDPMGDSGPEAAPDPFGDSEGEEDLLTEEQLQAMDLKELGGICTDFDLTPQDYIVKIKGKVNADKTKEGVIAAILEAQGAEEPDADAGTPDAASDDPF